MSALDPYGLVAQQQQSGLLQQSNAASHIKALQSLYGSGAATSPEMQAALHDTGTPNLEFGGTGRQGKGHWSDALIAGGRNFVGNYQKLNDYRARREMLQGAALQQRQYQQAQQQAMQQQVQAEGLRRQQQAQAQGEYIRKYYGQQLAEGYAVGEPEQQGEIYKSLGDAAVKGATQPGLVRGEALAKAQAAQDVYGLNAAAMEGLDLNTAVGRNRFQALMGFKPTTGYDVAADEAARQEAILKNRGLRISNEGGVISNEGNAIGNQIKAYQAVKEAVAARYAEPEAREKLGKAVAEGALKQQELENLLALPQVFDAAIQKMESGEALTNVEMIKLQGLTKMLGNKDPDMGKIFDNMGVFQTNKKTGLVSTMNPEQWNRFLGDAAKNRGKDPATWGIGANAVDGNLVQSPTTGHWYDKKTGDLVRTGTPPAKQAPARPAARPAAQPGGAYGLQIPWGGH